MLHIIHCVFRLEVTFKTVFWALFGMGDPDAVSLGEKYDMGFTERIGYIVFGAYHVTAVIVLLNMLIAMMSRSFDMIQVISFCDQHHFHPDFPAFY